MTPLESNRLVQLLRAIYPSMLVEPANKKTDSPGTLEIWFQFLSRYDIADCNAALEHFRLNDSARQFAPGLFEFEAAVRKVVEDRNARERAASDVKRIFHKPGDNAERSERCYKNINGTVREFIRVTQAERQRIHAEETARGNMKEVYTLPDGSKGYRYTPDMSQGPSATRTVAEMVEALSAKASMPEPEAQDYSERYEWGSVWETMDAAAALPMQDDTPITPADFRKQREAL